MGVFDALFRRKNESDDVVDKNSVSFDDVNMQEAQNLLNDNSISDNHIAGEEDWHDIIKEYEIFKDNYFKNPVDDPSTPDKIFIRDISELENKITEHIPKKVVEDEIVIKRLVEQDSGIKPLDFSAVREAPMSAEYSNKMFEQAEGQEDGLLDVFDETPKVGSHKVQKGTGSTDGVEKEEVVMFSQNQQDDFFNDFNQSAKEMQDGLSSGEDSNIEKTSSPENFEDSLLDYLFGDNEQKKSEESNKSTTDENRMKNKVFLFSDDNKNEINSADEVAGNVEKGKSKKAKSSDEHKAEGSSDAFLEYFQNLASSDGNDVTLSSATPSSGDGEFEMETSSGSGEESGSDDKSEDTQTEGENAHSSNDFSDFFSDLLQSAATIDEKTVALGGDEQEDGLKIDGESDDSYVNRVFLQRASGDISADTTPEEAIREKKRSSIVEKEVEGNESIVFSEIFTDEVKKADAEIIEDETAEEQIEEVVVKQKEVKKSDSSGAGTKSVASSKKVVEQEVDDPFSLMMNSMLDELGDSEEVESQSGFEKERPISEFFFSDSSEKMDRDKIDEESAGGQTQEKSNVIEKQEAETPSDKAGKIAMGKAAGGENVINVADDTDADVNIEGFSDSDGIKVGLELASHEQNSKATAMKASKDANAHSHGGAGSGGSKHDNAGKSEKIKLFPVPREVVVNHHYPSPVPVLVKEEVPVPVERIIETPQRNNNVGDNENSLSGNESDMFSSAYVDQDDGWMPLSESEKVGTRAENPTLVSSPNEFKDAGIVEKVDGNIAGDGGGGAGGASVTVDETGQAEQLVSFDKDAESVAVNKTDEVAALHPSGSAEGGGGAHGVSVTVDETGQAEQLVSFDKDAESVAVNKTDEVAALHPSGSAEGGGGAHGVSVTVDETGQAEQLVSFDKDAESVAVNKTDEVAAMHSSGSAEGAGGAGGDGVSIITDASIIQSEDAPKKKRRRRRRRRKNTSQVESLEANVVGVTEEESDIKITDEDASDSAEKVQIQKIEEVSLAGDDLTLHSSGESDNKEPEVKDRDVRQVEHVEQNNSTHEDFGENVSLDDYFRTSFLENDNSNVVGGAQSGAFATATAQGNAHEGDPAKSPEDWIGGGINATNGTFDDKFNKAFSSFGGGSGSGTFEKEGSTNVAFSEGVPSDGADTGYGGYGGYESGHDSGAPNYGQGMGTAFGQSVGIPVLQDSDLYVDQSIGTPVSFSDELSGDTVAAVPVGDSTMKQQLDFGVDIPTFSGEPGLDSQLFGVPVYGQGASDGAEGMGTAFDQSVGIPVLQDSDLYVDQSIGTPVSFSDELSGDTAVAVPVGDSAMKQQLDFGVDIPTFSGEPGLDSQLFGVPVYGQGASDGAAHNVTVVPQGEGAEGMDTFDLAYHNLASPDTLATGGVNQPQGKHEKPDKSESFFAKLLRKIKEFLFKERGKKKEDDIIEAVTIDEEVIDQPESESDVLLENGEDVVEQNVESVADLAGEITASENAQMHEESAIIADDFFDGLVADVAEVADVVEEDSSHDDADDSRTIHIKGIVLGGVAGYDVVLENGSVVRNNIDADESCYCSKDAVINGNISCSKAVIYGVVKGNIEASVSVEIRAGAMVFGDIISRTVIIDESALIQGNVCKSQNDKLI